MKSKQRTRLRKRKKSEKILLMKQTHKESFEFRKIKVKSLEKVEEADEETTKVTRKENKLRIM